MFEGYAESASERRQELLYLAWHIEAFARQKRLPSLKKILKDSGIKKKTRIREAKNPPKQKHTAVNL